MKSTPRALLRTAAFVHAAAWLFALAGLSAVPGLSLSAPVVGIRRISPRSECPVPLKWVWLKPTMLLSLC